jgi:hypothetical protein
MFKICFVFLIAGGIAVGQAAGVDTVFTTAFEASENYDANAELHNQNGWTCTNTAGNGLLSRFSGEGQQAYVGFFDPLNAGETFFSTWRPINFDPLTGGKPIVTFRTKMEIVDSTSAAPNKDDFRWDVYNSEGQRLLSLDFDNSTMGICYLLQGDTFFPTPNTFLHNAVYDVEIKLNFATDRWDATVGGTRVVSGQPIAKNSVKRDIGDIAATWVFLNTNSAGAYVPGDNAMVFDNYSITAEAFNPLPTTLRIVSVSPGTGTLVEMMGEPFRNYVIDGSSDFMQWTPIKTNMPSDGVILFLDEGVASSPMRGYRARVQ